MRMPHSLEIELVQLLSNRWSPKLILLAGSRASGSHKENSDWDLYLLGEYSGQKSIPEQYAGQNLDVVIRPITDLNQSVLSTFYGPIPALRVLLDDEKLTGQQIVAATHAAYQRGSRDRDPNERRADQLELNRYISKILARRDDLESCFSTFARVHALAMQLWFYDRGLWPLPPHQALPLIRSEDPKFAAQLAAITNCDESAVMACKAIAEGRR